MTLSAGTSGFLRGWDDLSDVPEIRHPGDAVAIGLEDVGLTDLDAAVDVRTVKSHPVTTVVILDDISRPGRVDTIFVRAAIAAPRLNRPLVAHGNNFRVGVALCHRSGTGVKSEDGNESQNDEEDEPLRVFVTIHDGPLSSPGRNVRVLQKTLLDARMACKQDEVSRHYFAFAKITP